MHRRTQLLETLVFALYISFDVIHQPPLLVAFSFAFYGNLDSSL